MKFVVAKTFTIPSLFNITPDNFVLKFNFYIVNFKILVFFKNEKGILLKITLKNYSIEAIF